MATTEPYTIQIVDGNPPTERELQEDKALIEVCSTAAGLIGLSGVACITDLVESPFANPALPPFSCTCLRAAHPLTCSRCWTRVFKDIPGMLKATLRGGPFLV